MTKRKQHIFRIKRVIYGAGILAFARSDIGVFMHDGREYHEIHVSADLTKIHITLHSTMRNVKLRPPPLGAYTSVEYYYDEFQLKKKIEGIIESFGNGKVYEGMALKEDKYPVVV